MSNKSDIWQAISSERLKVANLLANLKPGDWDQISLVPEWRVRDVVAHLILESNYKPKTYLQGILRSGLNINRFMNKAATDLGTRSNPEQLVGMLEVCAKDLRSPVGISPAEVLTDLIIHTQDIVKPLGIEYSPDSTVLYMALNNLKTSSFGLIISGAYKNMAGLKLVATDLNWSTGKEPTITGPAIDLMMAVAGRKSSLKYLNGPGKKIIERRLAGK